MLEKMGEKIKLNKEIFILLFVLVLAFKISLMVLFSSDYQNNLFIPLVSYFVNSGGANPWEYVYQNSLPYEFPYHPLMLYVYSIGEIIYKAFHIDNVLLHNFCFKLPSLIADLGIFYLLLKLFKDAKYKVLLYYFLSPIILYASYIHSQLDLLPVLFLFLSFYYLIKRKIFQSAVVYGLASCIKMNVILFLPIILTFILKKNNKRKTLLAFLISGFIYVAFSIPYIFTTGYQKLVLFNDKQNLLFNLSVPLGDIKIYVSLFVALLIYLRFISYKKINDELLSLYALLTISLFLLFVPPSTPAWFIWLVPFLTLFVIRYENKNKSIALIYWLFNAIYLAYFVFFHKGDYGDITFLQNPINLKISEEFLRNAMFTVLDAVLFGIIYYIYRNGIKSNSIYKKDRAVVIGIGGDSGSGKTTLLEDIKQVLLNELIVLEGDGDHKWERGDEHWEQMTHLNPKANSLHKQIGDILKLKKLEPIYRSDYNHSTGTFDAPVKIEPRQFVLLSGLHPFYLPKMRKTIDLKIYLNPDEDLRKFWKIQRDTKQRGYTKEEVLQAIDKRYEDAKKYIIPQKAFADLVISYYPICKDELNDYENNPKLGLKLEIDSSIHIEDILEEVQNLGVEAFWDYSDDLKTQYIDLSADTEEFNFKKIIRNKIDNIDEILPKEASFAKGQRGFIQLILLRVISEKMKDSYDKGYFN